MKTVFRSPVFPVLFKPVKANTLVICARTPAKLESYVERHAPGMDDDCELIDYSWERWHLYPKRELVCPTIGKKALTKRNFMLFCGASELQVSKFRADSYSRERIFDDVLKQANPPPDRAGEQRGISNG